MNKGRLEAFSDGFFAVIITITVLELHAPKGAGFGALRPILPVFLTYVMSFVYLGIYWNNHHHMLQVTRQVSGGVLWANLHLLFWLSLVPFVTGWMGENHFESVPTGVYGAVLLMSGIAYYILQRTIIAGEGEGSALAAAVGGELKGRISIVLYAVAIASVFLRAWIADGLYVMVALMWLNPDRRIERATKADVKE
jgi:uncharacterized membrane protein